MERLIDIINVVNYYDAECGQLYADTMDEINKYAAMKIRRKKSSKAVDNSKVSRESEDKKFCILASLDDDYAEFYAKNKTNDQSTYMTVYFVEDADFRPYALGKTAKIGDFETNVGDRLYNHLIYVDDIGNGEYILRIVAKINSVERRDIAYEEPKTKEYILPIDDLKKLLPECDLILGANY